MSAVPLGAERRGWIVWRRFARENGLILALALVLVGFGVIEPAFTSRENLVGILTQVALVGFMAVCSTFVVLSGGIDLSVGSVVALSGLAAASLLDASGTSMILALVAALALGSAIGAANGIAVAAFGLTPIVVTLATMSIVRGGALLWSGGELHLIKEPGSFLAIGSERIVGLPLPVIVFLGLIAVALTLERLTAFGTWIYCVGENASAARLAGLPVARARILAYTLSGLGAAIAGVVLASQVSTASATYGTGIELDVIAAIVIGGTSLFGGVGSVYRSVLGTLVVGAINNGLSILNVSTTAQPIAKGALIVLAISVDRAFARWADR